MEIHDAGESDLPGLLAIYNDVIATSTAIYSDIPVTLEDRTAWWRARVAMGYPVLIAPDESGVLGFATFGDFRSWPGYRFTVEHSVHVRADTRGRGSRHAIGAGPVSTRRRAGQARHDRGSRCRERGLDPLSRAARIRTSGHLREVGHKFDRWLDLVFLQRWIGAR